MSATKVNKDKIPGNDSEFSSVRNMPCQKAPKDNFAESVEKDEMEEEEGESTGEEEEEELDEEEEEESMGEEGDEELDEGEEGSSEEEDSNDEDSNDEDEKASVTDQPLQCRNIRIGSFKVHPKRNATLPVRLARDAISFNAPVVTDSTKIVNIAIKSRDVTKLLIHFGKCMPIAFIVTSASFGQTVRKSLNMSKNVYGYYDPTSTDEKKKNITFIIDSITQKQCHFLRHRFVHKSKIKELDQKSAKEILVNSTSEQTAPQEQPPAVRKRSSSPGPSGAKEKMPKVQDDSNDTAPQEQPPAVRKRSSSPGPSGDKEKMPKVQDYSNDIAPQEQPPAVRKRSSSPGPSGDKEKMPKVQDDSNDNGPECDPEFPSMTDIPHSDEDEDVVVLEELKPLECRSVRVGSFKIHPRGGQLLSIRLTTDYISFNAYSVTDDQKVVNVTIKPSDITKMFIHFGECLPILFIVTTVSFAQTLRTSLDMSRNGSKYYDPGSIYHKEKRITFLIDSITEDQYNFVRYGFIRQEKIMDIDVKTANKLLILSTP